ncbi:MAG: DUF5312 family protein [Spirochaetia bacterium]
MAQGSVFDTLVSQLSTDERRAMLEQINSSYTVSEEPIYTEGPEEPPIDLSETYKTLPFFFKMILFFKTIFTGKDRETVIEDLILRKIGKDIQDKVPGMVNISQNNYRAGFGDEMRKLSRVSRLFLTPLNTVMGPDLPEFIAFLAGIEDEIYNREMVSATDPYRVAETNPDLPERDIKRIVDGNLRELLEQFPADLKKKMYRNVRFLQALFAFASFPFSKIESRFMALDESVPLECPLFDLKDEMQELADIMHSMKFAPGPGFLKAVFIFAYRDKLEDEMYNLADDLEKKLSNAEEAFSCLRQFNASFPWVSVLRYTSGNVFYRPGQLGGGEDWFMQYKQFWARRLDTHFHDYAVKRKRQEMLSEMRDLLETETADIFDSLRLSDFAGKNRYAMSLTFIKNFFVEVFPGQFNRPLKILLLDGEFYKEANREEFTDAYNTLLKTKEKITLLEGRYGPEGDIGMPLNVLEKDNIPDDVKKKRIDVILKTAWEDSEKLLKNVLKDLKTLGDILYGILYGEIGGRYDTISNLGQIEGRNNKKYMKNLDTVLRLSRETRDLLGRMYDIENSA